MIDMAEVKIIGLAPSDLRCDCERAGCHQGDCQLHAYWHIEAYGIRQYLCAPCLGYARLRAGGQA